MMTTSHGSDSFVKLGCGGATSVEREEAILPSFRLKIMSATRFDT